MHSLHAVPKLTLVATRPAAEGQTEFTFLCERGAVKMRVSLMAQSEDMAREEAILIFREQVQANDEESTRIQRLS